MPNPRQLSEVLKSGARLRHISQRARAAVALREQVRTALPPRLAAHITGATQRRQELVLAVDSPAYCARLRFESPRLRAALAQATGLEFARISVRVQPPPR